MKGSVRMFTGGIQMNSIIVNATHHQKQFSLTVVAETVTALRHHCQKNHQMRNSHVSGSPRATGHTPFTSSSLIHPSPGSCNQTVENCTFWINESAIADHARKRKLLSNLYQQLSKFLYILWCLYLGYLSHLIETLGSFTPSYGAGWIKKIIPKTQQ